MKSDRELLELAAKAAGYVLVWGDVYSVGGDEVDCSDIPYIKSTEPDATDMHWNPLTDDGDALRLACKLKLNVLQGYVSVFVEDEADVGESIVLGPNDDRMAATRRAIVCAAAAIGEAMP